jgi:hypothetical protein
MLGTPAQNQPESAFAARSTPGCAAALLLLVGDQAAKPAAADFAFSA